MAGINVKRWLLGGVVAGFIVFFIEGICSIFYVDAMSAALDAHGLSMDESLGVMLLAVLISLLGGLVSIFFYAAGRPRFGPGPKTAIIVAVALFLGGYLPSLIGYHLLGLFPVHLLAMWGCLGLFEMILATLAGAAIYKEA